jgi:hypothetical protein
MGDAGAGIVFVGGRTDFMNGGLWEGNILGDTRRAEKKKANEKSEAHGNLIGRRIDLALSRIIRRGSQGLKPQFTSHT